MFDPERCECSVQSVTLASHRVSMTLGFVRSGNFKGCLGDDRAQARVFGLFVEETQLLVGDGQLGIGSLHAFAQFEQTTFDGCPGHERQCTRLESEITPVRVRTGAMRTECIRDFASDLHS